MNEYSKSAISRALKKIITPTNIGTAIGGLVGLATPWPGDEPFLAALGRIAGRTIGGMMGGRLLTKPTPAYSESPQFTGAAEAFLYPQSTILTPTPAATPPATSKTTTTTSTKTSTKAPGAVAPTPAAPTTKARVATPSPAPTPAATPPTTTTPATAKTGVVPTPPPAAGYSAPAPASLPPTPVMPGEMTQPITPENLARFEAMIRALQELAGGARYVPIPAIGAEPFGPAGALERALRRLREREVRV